MKKILIGLCALALLSACGQKGDAAAPDAQQAGATATADAVAAQDADKDAQAAAAAAAKQLAAYKAKMLPSVAGAYGGECRDKSGPAPKDGIAISGAGIISARDLRRDAMAADVSLSLGRELEAGQPVSAFANAASIESGWTFSVTSGKEESANLMAPDDAYLCSQVARAATLRAKPVYPTLAAFFVEAAATMSCVTGKVSSGPVPVKPGPSGVTVGSHNFAFDGQLKGEIAAVDAGQKTLTYTAFFLDRGQLLMALDHSGKLATLVASGKDDALFVCEAVKA